MMVGPTQAHDQLAAANPAPVVVVDRPSAAEFLEIVTGDVPEVDTPTPPRRPRWSGPALAFAIFAAVVLLGVVIATLSNAESDVVDSVPVPTTVLDVSAAQSVAEDLAVAYTSGDIGAVNALLADGTLYGWQRASDFVSGPVLWSPEDFASRYGIDMALNTTITLSNCQDLDENRVSCALLRHDDLVRAAEVEPAPDVRWRLTVVDGLITEWTEHTPDISHYFREVREPFHDWLIENHPDAETPFTDLRGQPWKPGTEFAEVAADLVAEYAADLEG